MHKSSQKRAQKDGKYITVEGPIGVGKSSLASKLAATYGANLVLEKPSENPFLERYYKSPEQFALATQLHFLFQRVEQLEDMRSERHANAGRVADFMIDKDPLFAQTTLSDDEFQLYQKVFNNLAISAPAVDLVIYLQAPVNVLQERVHKRRVRYEMGIELSYLQRLSDAYTRYFHHYNKSALLIVNAAEINPVDDINHYAALVNHIDQIDGGKHFFNPLA